MMKYNQLLIDEDHKTMELFKGLSEQEDQMLTKKVTLLIKQGQNIRLQVVAIDRDDRTIYLEGYTLIEGILDSF
ncbi:hypothetical protein HX017_08200 [Myroides marinus]|uniref:hypothetical protein n=1 Tax=Myroides TaxID=76831 RepID=UPI000742328B|nr:hypothetical protein [Myroides marinus]KUF43614.1 hypothetical protein AS361_13965 [Myroides marinus]MDM1347381.1 hypothetical protein [Myroides marinus]MDM1349768.1 hypothetical protein [Myroides marinus]MDM1353708.1 hypothetical protein [Myroides marinus]MDM1356977.1 hypothetical protein [Myroides marinus]